MSRSLDFTHFQAYDAGQPGISVQTILKFTDKSVTCDAKIDTGSTNCIFSRQIANELGIEIETGLRQIISTVNSRFTTYQHSLTLSVLDIDFDVLVCFAENEEFQRNVLGRRGFLENIQLGLIDYEGKLFLSKYTGE